MPYATFDGRQVYYADLGVGPPIITTHGLLETSSYWEMRGVAGRLALRHRVISMDIRGHGRSRQDGADDFAIEGVAADIGKLADELGFERFHLLTHATGGMAGVRYAMDHGDRLAGLILTDTASQTVFGDPAGYETLASIFEAGDWPELHASLAPAIGVFLFRIDAHPDAAVIHRLVREMYELNDPATMARFVRGFYTDPDPHVGRLRGIRCPTLVLAGEYDKALLKPSRLLADEIAGAELVILPGVGHMTALEDPDGTAGTVARFLAAKGR